MAGLLVAQTGDRRRDRPRPRAGWRSAGARPRAAADRRASTRWRRSRSPALAFGLAEVAHGSGFLAVYLTGLALGSARIPARRTIVAFHEGVGWVAQIGLFILLGLLVFPSTLGDVAFESLALSAVLILRRPPPRGLRRDRLLAARPARAGDARLGRDCAARRRSGSPPSRSSPASAPARQLFSIVFFVVVTSTLIQGASFEPLASRLGLTTDEPALPRRLLESGRIRRMGGDVVSYRLRPGAAAAGHLVRELGLPREALVNVIVRDGHAIPPRGSTEVREGDELHILVRGELREEVEELTVRWHEGPVGAPAAAAAAAPRRPADLLGPVPAARSRTPRRRGGRRHRRRLGPAQPPRPRPAPSSRLPTAATRWSTETVVAIGGRRALAAGASGGAARAGDDPAERAWWQEVIGALIARG